MKRMKLFLLMAVACSTAIAQNIVSSEKVIRRPIPPMPSIPYQPIGGNIIRSCAYRKAVVENGYKTDESGLQADFSIQDGVSQVKVWSEGFDTDLSQWTVNNEVKDGWGPVTVELASTAQKREPFTTYDESDVTSLHIEGDYRVSKRNMAYVTSGDIVVPQNAQLHAYVGYSEWEECALFISVSTDGFETETELWNSMNCGITGWHWQLVESSLEEFAGQILQVRFTYGEGTKNNFGVGGYMGDFWIDGLSITGVETVSEVNVLTGEVIQFVDLSEGDPVRWEWQFPGGTPATSEEQNPTIYYEKSGEYDVTLTVYSETTQEEESTETTQEEESTEECFGQSTVTKTAFVRVEGQMPVAGVLFPADFRELNSRLRMVAPFAEVEYKDASTGFPEEFSWTFYTPYDLEHAGLIFQPDTIYTTRDVSIRHDRLDKNYVTHIAQNELGYDYVDESVTVKFDGLVTNFLPEDGLMTNFVDGDLTLPGANRMGITAWAERFSKPSVPVVLEGMYVNFTKAWADELTDQISNVNFSLYTSENGLPDESLMLLDSWTISELNYAMNASGGVATIELSVPIVIDQEVFVVIDGIPEKNDQMECAIGMAPLRSEGNTAYMLNKGTWRPFTGYFEAAPGGQTSLAVFPYYTHSVVVPAAFEEMDVVGETLQRIIVGADSTVVNQESGQAELYVFANRGVTYLGTSEEWCRILGEPGEYTVDTLDVEYDALPDDMERREAVITVTDGITTLPLRFIQERVEIPEPPVPTSIEDVLSQGDDFPKISQENGTSSERGSLYDLLGRLVADDSQNSNIVGGSRNKIYIVKDGKQARKTVSR